MENQYLLINTPKNNINYKKLKNNRSSNYNPRKKLPKNSEISTYDEIISRAKNTIDIFQKQLEQTIPSIINYENDINNIKNTKSYQYINQPIYKQDQKTARISSGSSAYFQPILTDIGNMSKEQIMIEKKNEEKNNEGMGDYFKKLYKKSKDENLKLIERINELENLNINNEGIILEYKNENTFLVEKIKELENIINEYENNSNNINNFYNSNNGNENDYMYLNIQKNKIMKENEDLKNEIKKILKDNNSLKIKIKSIEKMKNFSMNNSAKNIQIKNNNTEKSKNSKNNDLSSYNKSFRVISNLSLYNKANKNKNSGKKQLQERINNNSNVNNNSKKRINKTEIDLKIMDTPHSQKLNNDNNIENITTLLKNENSDLTVENIELNKENNILKNKINELISQKQLEDDNKDSYINELEEVQRQNKMIIIKVKEENNNLLNEIDKLNQEINNINLNKNDEISKLNIEIESLNKEKEILKKNELNKLRAVGNNAKSLEEKLLLSTKEIEKLKDYQKKYNSLNEIIDNLKNDINILNNKNIELKDINEEKDKEINEYMKKINNLEIDILKMKEELIEKNDNNKKMNKINEDILEENKNKEKDI